MSATSGDAAPAEVRWRCRRGMRELDVLLERYLAGRWPAAAAAERAAFLELLELPDPDLAGLLLGAGEGPAALRPLLARLKAQAAGELSGQRMVYPDDPVGGRTPGDDS